MSKSDRRVQRKVETLGMAELVSRLLAQGVTYEEIAEECKRQGAAIGKSSIARYNDSIVRKMEKIKQTQECATALATVIKDRTGEEPDVEMTDLLLAALQHTLLDKLGDEVSIKDLVGLSIAGSSVAKAKTSVERLKERERERAKAAWEKVIKESRRLLEKASVWPEVEKVLAAGMAEAVGQE